LFSSRVQIPISLAIDVKAIENRLQAHQQSPESNVLTSELLGRVWNIVSGLSERQRRIFYLWFVGERSLSEIARATGLKVNAIKSHLHGTIGTVRLRIGTAQQQSDTAGTKY
jgi:RNA polymerase sigma factor (sigma-70 family)